MAGRKPGEADGTLTVRCEWLSNLPYSELAEAVDRRARRFGVSVVLVDPAYTSVEGRWRFAGNLGWSVHEAAALCTGRKAPGHRRRFGRRLRGRLGVVRSALAGRRMRQSDWPRRALRRKDHRGRLQADRDCAGGGTVAAQRRHRGQGPGCVAGQRLFSMAGAAR